MAVKPSHRPLTVRRLIQRLINLPQNALVVVRNDQGFITNVEKVTRVETTEACDEYHAQYVTGGRGHAFVEIGE